MREPLAQIEKGLQRLNRGVLLRALRPGISADRTRSFLSQARLPTSAQVEVLYAWRDGTETEDIRVLDEIHLFPGFYLLSMQDAIKNYRTFASDPRWTPGWLPIFANGGGDFYVTDMSAELAGVVRHFRIEQSEHPVEFLSIDDMVKTVAAGFERGLFFVDTDGYLEMDDLDYASVAAQLNPGVPWWT